MGYALDFHRFLNPYTRVSFSFLVITNIWQKSQDFWFTDFFLKILKSIGWYSLKESKIFYNLYYYLRRYSHFYVSWNSRRSRGEALCVFSICAEILSVYNLFARRHFWRVRRSVSCGWWITKLFPAFSRFTQRFFSLLLY